MGIIAWIIIGGIAGWIASKIMGTDKDMGIIKNVLAGVIGGSTFVTEPAMAATVGSVIFVVVVVGGMGSLAGAFVASVLIGVIQTFAVAIDYSVLDLARLVGWQGAVTPEVVPLPGEPETPRVAVQLSGEGFALITLPVR